MADDDPILTPKLWTPRSGAETLAMYRDWAASYDADVTTRGYRTPARMAATLAAIVPQDTLVLDYGCGTGLSGLALREKGFRNLAGTDVTPEMLEIARSRDIYAHLWLSEMGQPRFQKGQYPVIFAAGVISLGAAPPDLLSQLMDLLGSGGLIVFSYNDPTLADKTYNGALQDQVGNDNVELVSKDHGPHLDDIGMGSDVIVLRRI